MRRSVLAAILFLSTTTLVAAETQRYIVVTKRPFQAGNLRAAMRELRSDVQPRSIVGFHAVDGFAADLTEVEANALAASPSVQWVEPVVERHAQASAAQSVPYGITMVHAPEVWVGATGKETNVVVVDTGVDWRHPELAAIYKGGYNTFNLTNNPMDDNGHGTHVAGTIAAADNSVGVVGIAPNIRLWAVKVLNAQGSGTSDKLIASIDWVLNKKKEVGGNWILNYSLGASRGSAAEQAAFKKATDAGIIVVAASGNESTKDRPAAVIFPGAYPDVITVGAVDSASVLAEFSNQGPSMDLVAPGVSILSTVPLGTGELSYVFGKNNHVGVALGGSKRGTFNAPYVFCGLGKKEEIPASVSGKIAVMQRGEIRFSEKARNAKDAGAVAVVIYNNEDSALNWTLRPTDEPQYADYDYPTTVGLTQAQGQALLAENAATLTVAQEPDDYAVFSGTSMATPHVTGAVALLWSLQPNFTNKVVTDAILGTARDLGTPGGDEVFGRGLLNVFDAAKMLAPSTFGAPAPPPTGRRILKRGRG
jgi:serine protease